MASVSVYQVLRSEETYRVAIEAKQRNVAESNLIDRIDECENYDYSLLIKM